MANFAESAESLKLVVPLWPRNSFGKRKLELLTAPAKCVQRLFVFPWAGGNYNGLRSLAEALGEQHSGKDTLPIEVWGMSYPGRAERLGEKGIDDFGTLVDYVVHHLLVLHAQYGLLAGPYSMLGYSMGSHVALHTSVRITRLCAASETTFQTPISLVACACGPPDALIKSESEVKKPIREMTEDELVDFIVRKGGSSREVFSNTAMRSMILPPIYCDYQALSTYEAAVTALKRDGELTIPCDIAVVIGSDDKGTKLEDMAQWHSMSATKPDGGAVYTVSGGHFFVQESLAEVAQAIYPHIVV